MPHTPAIRHLGIYPREISALVQKEAYARVFTAASFKIAPTAKKKKKWGSQPSIRQALLIDPCIAIQ